MSEANTRGAPALAAPEAPAEPTGGMGHLLGALESMLAGMETQMQRQHFYAAREHLKNAREIFG